VCHVPSRTFLSHRRYVQYVKARYSFYFCARALTSRSFPEIARFVGWDHSTLVHGVQRVKARREQYEPELSLVLDYFVKSEAVTEGVYIGHSTVPALFSADSVC